MSSILKRFFVASKYPITLMLVIAINVPIVVLGQEEATTTTTLEFTTAVNNTITTATTTVTTTLSTSTTTLRVATTTPPTSTTTPPVATSTNELLPLVIEPENIATTTGKVLGISSTNDTEENPVEESNSPVVIVEDSPSSKLSVREFKKHIVSDNQAFHSCEAEVFRIDVSNKILAKARIMLQRDSDAPYDVEVGGLPLGIDITFSKNGLYQYVQGPDDRFLELVITNQSGSPKGNFSVPIIYTQKSARDSSVICQINIVNQ